MYKKYLSLVFLISTLASSSHAVRTNGIDDDEKYIELAKNKSFSAVGYIRTPEAQFTGTIIDDKGVGVTCAHGFKEYILDFVEKNPDCLNFRKPENFYTLSREAKTGAIQGLSISLDSVFMGFQAAVGFSPYRVKSCIVHPEYISRLVKNDKECGSNFYPSDIAFFELESKPDFITPIPLLENTFGIRSADRTLFLGYGMGEGQENLYAKRAAYIPNLDLPSQYEKYSYFKSIYFNPEGEAKGWNDQAQWVSQNKPIYGHGESGDSGGPLILMNNNQTPFIIGVVSGGGGLRGGDVAAEDEDVAHAYKKEDLYGKLYSLYAPTVTIINGRGMATDSMIDQIYLAMTRPRASYVPPVQPVISVVEETKKQDVEDKSQPKLSSAVLPEHREEVKGLSKKYKTVIAEIGKKGPGVLRKVTPIMPQALSSSSSSSQQEPEKMNFTERLKMFNNFNKQ